MDNDSALVNQLLALGSDVQARKRNLLELASSLTHHEARELIAYLNNIDFRVDIIARLPVELVLHVANYIDGTDILNCLHVSKTWRLKWAQEDVAKRLSQIFLPRFWEYSRLKEEVLSTKQDMARSFCETVRKHHFRSQGKFTSFFSHGPWTNEMWDKYIPLDPVLHPPRPDGRSPWLDIMINRPSFSLGDHPTPAAMWYENGRIAWQLILPPDDVLFMVDDLRTQRRKVFTIPGLSMRGLWAALEVLGDKLLAASENRTLHVWHLETNQRRQVTLPGVPQFFSSHGERVYAFGRTSDVYVFNYTSGKLRVLDTSFARAPLTRGIVPSRVDSDSDGVPAVLSAKLFDACPHPVLNDTVYVVGHLGEFIERSEALVVFELVKNKYKRTFTFDLSGHPDICTDRYRMMDCRKAGSWGLYGILSLWPNPRCESECQFCRQGTRRAQLVCFDMLNACFSVQSYTIPWFWQDAYLFGYPSYRMTRTAFWWNGQMTTWAVGRHSFDPALFVAAVRDPHVSHWNSTASTVPVHSCFPERKQWATLVSKRLNHITQVEVPFVLDRGNACPGAMIHMQEAAELQENAERDAVDDAFEDLLQFDGDDDFIVFFYRCGYAVWRFD